jgi:glycosyltransferase involved in cell wall biosynthesis
LFHALFGKLIGARTAVTFHGTDLYRVGNRKLFRWLVRSFDEVYYVSRAMEHLLNGCVSADRLHYTPNGVDLDRFSPGDCPRENVILTVGVLKWQKGVDVLLAAFADFVREFPGWKLQIAGDGPLLQKYRCKTDELGLSGRVEWLGQVPQERLVNLYRSARIFALSSLSEGFPKVLLESMACGTPVVATDVGSCREVTGEAGLVVPPKDPIRLRDALVELASRGDCWDRMSRAATERSKLYSWDRTAEVVAAAISSFSG